MMTVKELIKRLKKMPQNKEVCFFNHDDEYDIELTTIDVTEERHNSWKKICSILENLNMFKGTTIEQITIG